MTDDGSALGDDHDGELVDELVEELRRLNPVDAETLPSSRSPDAMRTLERILHRSSESEPELEAEAEADNETELEAEAELEAEVELEADDSSPSPAADSRGGREAPPPCPAPR